MANQATERTALLKSQSYESAIPVQKKLTSKDDIYNVYVEGQGYCGANMFNFLDTEVPDDVMQAMKERGRNTGDENMKEEEVPWSPTWVYIFNFLIVVGIGVYPIYSCIKNGYYQTLYVNFGLLAFFWIYGWFFGYCGRTLYSWYAGYTRKCVHFALFLIPFALDYFWQYDMEAPGFYKAFFSFWVRCVWTYFQIWPFRHYTEDMFCPQRMMGKFFRLVMRANDRPEDRPNTMTWVTLQVVGGSIVFLPFNVWWAYIDRMQFGFIPIMTTGLGDGLAEPVGKKCGKHKYYVQACCTKRRYTRSVEGSATVFIMGLAMSALMYGNNVYFWHWILMMILVPPIMTFVEAKSPHTLDNPTLYFAGSIIPTLIHYLPMRSPLWPWWATMLCVCTASIAGIVMLYYIPGEWIRTVEENQIAPSSYQTGRKNLGGAEYASRERSTQTWGNESVRAGEVVPAGWRQDSLGVVYPTDGLE